MGVCSGCLLIWVYSLAVELTEEPDDLDWGSGAGGDGWDAKTHGE